MRASPDRCPFAYLPQSAPPVRPGEYPARRILILKTGYSETLAPEDCGRTVSLGDVLRTTPLLRLFRRDLVTWVTDESALPLLRGAEGIDRLVGFTRAAVDVLTTEPFDVVINLDRDPELCALADAIQARHRYGFRATVHDGEAPGGGVLAEFTDSESRRLNRKSVQQLLFETVGAIWNGEEYVVGCDPRVPVTSDVALNTNVGRKWPQKRWPPSRWDELESILRAAGYAVTRQDTQPPEVCTHIPDYVAWLASAVVVVTADSLGLHVALALRKRVVALFGPTPAQEVHLYGRGVALLPDPSPACAPCLRSTCQAARHCMDDIRPDLVARHVEQLLSRGASVDAFAS